MPAFDTSVATTPRTFAGIALAAPLIYSEGHALTAGEASFLNAQVASVVGNAYSGKVKKAKDAGKDISIWDHQTQFNEMIAAYALGPNRGGKGGGTADKALERRVLFLASEDLKARLARNNISVGAARAKKLDDGKTSVWSHLLAQTLDASRETFTEQAKAELANAPAPSALDAEIASLGLSTQEPTAIAA